MIWSFFKNPGGQESGFSDAGVETFKGNLERYLAREVIQNSLDARDDPKKPVNVKFELLELPTSTIPDFKNLAATFQRCADYWPKDQRATEFFKRAASLSRAKKVTALRIGDYNTKGVTGTDTDRGDCWYSLIRCSGASSKWEGEGGSFGIGKNAPFAASRMRTVLYSTMTKDKDVAFQGVARLVTHDHPKGGKAQHIGYLGEKDGASVRNKKELPDDFLRAKPGTDLIILAYNDDGEWQKDLIHSVLENFWPAIHFGDLEVVVDGTKINRGNLAKLMNEYSTADEFTAHYYYRSFTDKDAKVFEDKLPTLKKVEVHLLAGDQYLPQKVAMVRKTGMIIYLQHFRSLVRYCGVFLCRNEEGNKILRQMEPPKHDEWDPNHPEKNMHRKTASEFTSYIRECIKKLAPADGEKVLSIPDLNQYLPDDEEAPDEGFEGVAEQEKSKRESFERQPEKQKISTRKIDKPRQKMQPDETHPGEGEADTDQAGGGKGTIGGNGEGTNDTDGGKGGGGGEGDGASHPQKGGGAGHNAKPAIPLHGRVFAKDLANGVYTVIAQPIKPVNGNILLSIKAVGDDSTSSTVAIQSARMDGKDVPIPKQGAMGPVRLNGRPRLLIDVKLTHPRKLAMEVEAHEAE
jgi:hypothetical protein